MRLRNLLITVLAVLLTYVVTSWSPRSVHATNNPISIMKTPTANLTLAQNVIVSVPGTFCNVTVWNNSTTPVFVGGPKLGSPPVVKAGTTVNSTAGMPICTDATACRDSLTSINVNTGGIALLQTAVASLDVRVMLGEGCGS